MTHWRQTGIVPASDGEDSDDQLSTQENDVDVFQLVSQFVPPDVDTSSRQSTQTESAQLQDENQDARGVEAEAEPETVPMDIDIFPPKQRSQETVKKAPIMMIDLAYPDDDDDDEGDEDMDIDSGGVSLKASNGVQQCKVLSANCATDTGDEISNTKHHTARYPQIWISGSHNRRTTTSLQTCTTTSARPN